MAYHGHFISLPEAHSSVSLLISVLSLLGCDRDYITTLKITSDRIVDSFRSETKIYQKFTSTTVLKTMLHRSFAEFEVEFSEYFEQQELTTCERDLCAQKARKPVPRNPFSQLCKKIRKAFPIPMDRKNSKHQGKIFGAKSSFFSCSKCCANVTDVRNKFAHNFDMRNKEVICGL